LFKILRRFHKICSSSFKSHCIKRSWLCPLRKHHSKTSVQYCMRLFAAHLRQETIVEMGDAAG
jgi:hypothetical protein